MYPNQVLITDINFFGFHVWLQNQESRKNLISTVTHLTRYIEVVLMRMSPHTFSHMMQNSTSISDSRHMAQN